MKKEGAKKNTVRLVARKSEKGMDIFISQFGDLTYLMHHRYAPPLYQFLKQEGATIASCKSYKPRRRNYDQQQLWKSLQHVVRVAEWVMRDEKLYAAA